MVTLVISDVPGDDPGTIASGPTVPGTPLARRRAGMVARYGVALPPAAAALLARRGQPAASLAAADVRMIATPAMALPPPPPPPRGAGLTPLILGDALEGESRELGTRAGRHRPQRAQPRPAAAAPCVLLSGGETTVTIGTGRRGAAGATRSSCSASPWH